MRRSDRLGPFMRISLPYADGEVPVLVPAYAVVARGQRAPALRDPMRALVEALEFPVGSPRLEDLARGRRTACIVISDNTRAVPNRLVLPEIVSRIRGEIDEIQVVIANGLHPPLGSDAMTELVGHQIATCYPVLNHDPRDRHNLEPLGITKSGGIPMWISRRYWAADLRILVGLVEPHFMAGFSGGRKSVCPGISGLQTIEAFHSPALLESQLASAGVLSGNPVHAAACEAAAMAPADFVVNVVLGESLKPSSFVAGDMFGAWEVAVETVAAESCVAVDGQYDVVLLTNGGHPLDRNFYQTVKGLVTASMSLRPGGTIVMTSACTDGLGTPAFKRGLESLRDSASFDEFIERISEQGHFMEEQWEVEEYVRALRTASRIILCASGLSEEDAHLAGVELFGDPQEALESAMEGRGETPRILVLPEGPYCIPTCTGSLPRWND